MRHRVVKRSASNSPAVCKWPRWHVTQAVRLTPKPCSWPRCWTTPQKWAQPPLSLRTCSSFLSPSSSAARVLTHLRAASALCLAFSICSRLEPDTYVVRLTPGVQYRNGVSRSRALWPLARAALDAHSSSLKLSFLGSLWHRLLWSSYHFNSLSVLSCLYLFLSFKCVFLRIRALVLFSSSL